MMSRTRTTPLTKSPPLKFCWMNRAAMHTVLAIEAESFAYPWHWADFFKVLSRRDCIGIVAGGWATAGFVIMQYRPRAMEILNLAVAKDCRRHGVGTAMVEDLRRRCLKTRRTTIWANVGDRNFAAHQFFKRCGFRAVGVRRGAFEAFDDVGRVLCVEDAYRFRLSVVSGQ